MILGEEELTRWGNRIGAEVETPVFLALRGELGAGKSVLARAVARGAGVSGPIPSPTFNLLFRYPARGGVEVVHLDLYRISDPDELWELGWEELGDGPEIVLVEWAGRAGSLLPEDRWEIGLSVPEVSPAEAASRPARNTGGVRVPVSRTRLVRVERVGDPPPLPGFPMALSRSGEGR